jgi:hypothetical protein
MRIPKIVFLVLLLIPVVFLMMSGLPPQEKIIIVGLFITLLLVVGLLWLRDRPQDRDAPAHVHSLGRIMRGVLACGALLGGSLILAMFGWKTLIQTEPTSTNEEDSLWHVIHGILYASALLSYGVYQLRSLAKEWRERTVAPAPKETENAREDVWKRPSDA